MEQKTTLFSSATNITLLVMMFALTFMSCYSLLFLEYERFDYVFGLFSNILIAVSSFFFGKSTMETANRKAEKTEQMIKEATAFIPGTEEKKAIEDYETV